MYKDQVLGSARRRWRVASTSIKIVVRSVIFFLNTKLYLLCEQVTQSLLSHFAVFPLSFCLVCLFAYPPSFFPPAARVQQVTIPTAVATAVPFLYIAPSWCNAVGSLTKIPSPSDHKRWFSKHKNPWCKMTSHINVCCGNETTDVVRSTQSTSDRYSSTDSVPAYLVPMKDSTTAVVVFVAVPHLVFCCRAVSLFPQSALLSFSLH